MKKRSLIGLVVVALMVSVLPGAGLAQDDASEHPIVGTWFIGDGGMAIFHGDGTFLSYDPDGLRGLGAWEPSGEQTADLTFGIQAGQYEGLSGLAIVRSSFEVGEDGLHVTGTSTIDVATPEGDSTGELGPMEVAGTRMVVEPMGEPVGPLPTELDDPTE